MYFSFHWIFKETGAKTAAICHLCDRNGRPAVVVGVVHGDAGPGRTLYAHQDCRSRLGGLVSSVVGVPLVWRTFAHYSPEALQRSLAHHREIVDALRARDPSWAESVMRSHIHASWAFIKGNRNPPGGNGAGSG